jgi:hypothetical protein
MERICKQGIRAQAAGVFIFAFALSGTSFAEDGVVIEAESGRPIPNAIVVTTWRGQAMVPGEGGTICQKAEIAVTDVQGRFSVSSTVLNPGLYLTRRRVSVLSRGYRGAEGRDSDSLRVPMVVDRRPANEWLAAMAYPMGGCQLDHRAFLPYYRELFEEAAPLAKTIEEKLKVNEVQYQIESVELGDTEALVRAGARERKIRRGEQ